MADYWAGTGDGPPDFGLLNPKAGRLINAGLRQLPDVVSQSTPAAPVASVAAPVAVPTHSVQSLPAGVARRQVGDTQIYAGVGAHGEPVYSDTVAGAQQINPETGRKWAGDGTVPASLEASDPNVVQRRAVGALSAQDASGYPGGMVGGVPSQFRQPVPPTGPGPDQTADTQRRIVSLRSAPGGDQEWASNSLGMRPGDALRLSPQQRQAAVNEAIAYNAKPGADADTVAANRSLLAQIDQSPRPGAYDPTGYSYRNTVGGQGPMGAANPLEYMRFAAEQGNEQANRELAAEKVSSGNRRFDAERADKLDKDAAEEVGATAAAFNKDNPNDPIARRAAGMQYVLDHFNDTKARGNATYRQGLNALQSELRLQGTPTWWGRNISGVPDMSQQPISRFDVEPNHSFFGGPAKALGPALRRAVGSDGRGSYAPATGEKQPGDVQYENAGGLFDHYQRSPTLDTLLQRPQNLDALRQILAQNRKGQ